VSRIGVSVGWVAILRRASPAVIGVVTMSAEGPATRADLEAHLVTLGIRRGTYELFGAHAGGAIVLDHRAHGWVVFYSDRANESDLATFADEAEACAELLARVVSDEHTFFDLVAGPAPKVYADRAFDTWLATRGTSRSQIAPTDWKCNEVPWVEGPRCRRYYVRITTKRQLEQTN